MIIFLGYLGPFVEIGGTLYAPVSWTTWFCYSKLIRWLWETGQVTDAAFAQDGWGVEIGSP